MNSKSSKRPFILASASPRRRALLRQVGLPFRVTASQVEETNRSGMEPHRHAAYWARVKAQEVSRRHPDDWVLGADTIVVLEGSILGKPAGAADAARMLSLLSGRSHEVITGLCLLRERPPVREQLSVETKVLMKRLTPEEIQGYIATGEPMDKAGAYGIQGIGGSLVERIEGSYSNVVGLPLCEAVELLRRHGVADPFRRC
jgi:septum formation protein